ncbi:MAG: type I glutamate--ammonia ligase, partial [Propioniciclava sp.]
PAPIDKDLYELPPEEHAEIAQVPSSLGDALAALEADHEYLLAGDVFTADLIETWIDMKREDITALRLRPHPHEFEMYFDL